MPDVTAQATFIFGSEGSVGQDSLFCGERARLQHCNVRFRGPLQMFYPRSGAASTLGAGSYSPGLVAGALKFPTTLPDAQGTALLQVVARGSKKADAWGLGRLSMEGREAVGLSSVDRWTWYK